MASNPVKGPSPSDPMKGANETRTSSSPHRKIEKVEKVGEVDPEQQSRARKFRAMVEEENSDDAPNSQHPSPIHLFSAEDKPKPKLESKPSSFSNDEPANPVPSPAYSPPPSAVSGSEEETEKQTPLPRSDDFWADIDEPLVKEAPKKPTFTEKISPSPEHPSGAKKKKEEFSPSAHLGIPIKKEPSPYDLMSQKEAKEIKPKNEKKEAPEEIAPSILTPVRLETRPAKEPASPMSRQLTKEEEKPALPGLPERKKRLDTEKFGEEKKFKRPETAPPAQQNETAGWTPANPFQQRDKNQKKKDEVEWEIPSPSAHPLPQDIIPIASAATAAAMPYLKPETLSLFYQMVGTIYVMSQPTGVTRTEVILNAASYAQSKFYGASIIIEKYAAAPDSFNIRLTGSNEAVASFNQNIPNLMAAFRKGNFSFGIGRIEAEYKDEKPVFRRKEGRKGDDLNGEFTDKGRE